MRYSLTDVKRSMPQAKAKKDALWVKMWVRQLSYPLSALALNFGLTPNQISIISIIDTIAACFLICTKNDFLIIVGFILLNLFILFDCIDGTMARTLKKASYMGEFYDAIGGYTICALSLFAGGICALNTGNVLYVKNLEFLALFSGLGSICNIFSRLIYQKYLICEFYAKYRMKQEIKREYDEIKTDERPKMSLTLIYFQIDRQFGTGGLFPPLLLLFYLINAIDIIIVLYSIYYILLNIISVIVFSVRASKFDRVYSDILNY